MDNSCTLGSLKSSTVSESSDPGVGIPELQLGRRNFFFSCPLYFFCILTLFFLPYVPLSYFKLAVFMLECLDKHSLTRSSFPIAILNGICFFSETRWILIMPKLLQSKTEPY